MLNEEENVCKEEKPDTTRLHGNEIHFVWHEKKLPFRLTVKTNGLKRSGINEKETKRIDESSTQTKQNEEQEKNAIDFWFFRILFF